MSRAWLGAAALLVTACELKQVDVGADAATRDTGAPVTGSDSGGGVLASGLDCFTPPFASATLCRAISLCPDVYVDPDVFPDCGFAVHGNALDLRCGCDQFVCPMGTASGCDEVTTLLQTTSQALSCVGADQGVCAGP